MLTRVGQDWYENEEGRRYLRVSRALDVLNKPGLKYWAATLERKLVLESAGELHADLSRTFFTKPQKIPRDSYLALLVARLPKRPAFHLTSKKALDTGSQTHAMIEWVLRQELCKAVGNEPPMSDQAKLCFGKWEVWRKKTRLKPLAIEASLRSDEDGYAGTPDLVAEIDLGRGQELVILDWKTSKGFYLEMELQNAAYVKAYCEQGGAKYPIPGLLVRLPKDSVELETKEVEKKDQADLYQGFKLALNLAKFLLDRAKRGKPCRETPEKSQSPSSSSEEATPT